MFIHNHISATFTCLTSLYPFMLIEHTRNHSSFDIFHFVVLITIFPIIRYCMGNYLLFNTSPVQQYCMTKFSDYRHLSRFIRLLYTMLKGMQDTVLFYLIYRIYFVINYYSCKLCNKILTLI